MKVAVSGKGGAGKTTLTALLARRLLQRGQRVLAIDADSNTNLAAAVEFPSPERIVPIAAMKALIAERVGTGPGSAAAYFRLNPRVDDLPAKHCVEHDGIKLIVMGTIERGGAGCVCGENALLKTLLAHILLGPDENVVVDMEAGLEHLGRGTAASVDRLLVVVEPELRSVEALKRIRRLASDIGISDCRPVANKVASPEDRAFLSRNVPGDEFVAWLPRSEVAVRASRGEASLKAAEPAVWQEIDRIIERISP